MANEIQNFTDNKGNKTSVIVSFEEWQKLNARQAIKENKLKIFKSVREGIKEVKEARKTNQKLQTLSEFINENRS
jgi:rRNA maturation endonuclease Nob1